MSPLQAPPSISRYARASASLLSPLDFFHVSRSRQPSGLLATLGLQPPGTQPFTAQPRSQHLTGLFEYDSSLPFERVAVRLHLSSSLIAITLPCLTPPSSASPPSTNLFPVLLLSRAAFQECLAYC